MVSLDKNALLALAGFLSSCALNLGGTLQGDGASADTAQDEAAGDYEDVTDPEQPADGPHDEALDPAADPAAEDAALPEDVPGPEDMAPIEEEADAEDVAADVEEDESGCEVPAVIRCIKPSRETFIDSNDVMMNFGDHENVQTERWGGAHIINKGLIAFDLSIIPSCAAVESAILTMHVVSWWGEPELVAYEILGPWGEMHVTWENAPEYHTEGVSLPAVAWGPNTWDLTPLVGNWLDDPPGNHGIMVFPSKSNCGADFASREYWDDSKHPCLALQLSPSTAE
ncbi:MAG: DNRLRE domain-containing protein [Pseudomonadota bacterium]